jgi:hypothetical protein
MMVLASMPAIVPAECAAVDWTSGLTRTGGGRRVRRCRSSGPRGMLTPMQRRPAAVIPAHTIRWNAITRVALTLALVAPVLPAEAQTGPASGGRTGAQSDAARLRLEVVKDLAGTLRVDGKSLTRSGALVGCTLEFDAVVLDHQYRQGQPSLVAGSITLNLVQQGSVKNIGVGLKVVLKDATVRAGSPEVHYVDAPPYFAFLETPSGVSNVGGFVSKIKSDTPGGTFLIYRMDDSFMPIYEALTEGSVVVAFTRKKDGLDVRVPLDLQVEQTDSSQVRRRSAVAMDRFHACVGTLIDLWQR